MDLKNSTQEVGNYHQVTEKNTARHDFSLYLARVNRFVRITSISWFETWYGLELKMALPRIGCNRVLRAMREVGNY